MPIFIKLSKRDRGLLFSSLRDELAVPWDKICQRLGVSKPMFFHYKMGRKLIPDRIFGEIIKITGFKPSKVEKVEKEKYEEKEIVLPKFDERLCEILGILNGDGHLSAINYEISVVGNALEKDYAAYLKRLFEEKFKMSFNLSANESSFKVRTYSKRLANYLNKEYGLPLGNKMMVLRVPPKIYYNKNYLIPYLRGLFDTDGCFHIRRKKDPVIEITSADPRFLREVKRGLTKIGLHVANGQKRIFIYRKKDVSIFFEKIQPANSKHLKKYQSYLKLNNAPMV